MLNVPPKLLPPGPKDGPVGFQSNVFGLGSPKRDLNHGFLITSYGLETCHKSDMIAFLRVPSGNTVPVQLFRCFSVSSRQLQPSSISRLTVFGAGTMGTGISQVALQTGVNVVICDPNAKALEWVFLFHAGLDGFPAVCYVADFAFHRRKAQAFILQQISENSSDRAGSLSTSTDMYIYPFHIRFHAPFCIHSFDVW